MEFRRFDSRIYLHRLSDLLLCMIISTCRSGAAGLTTQSQSRQVGEPTDSPEPVGGVSASQHGATHARLGVTTLFGASFPDDMTVAGFSQIAAVNKIPQSSAAYAIH